MIIPGQRTKFNLANSDYINFFKLTSEIFARSFDNMYSVYPDLSNKELLNNFYDIERRIWIIDKLGSINIAREHIKNETVVLRFTKNQELVIMPVPLFQEVMKFYFRAETDYPDDDVVLVNAHAVGDIRSAYRNYFSDTTEFLHLLESAIYTLS